MTEQELNRVRDIGKQIRDIERHLQALRMNAENIVPVLDGLPHSATASSRVEKLALLIMESERELTELRGQLIQEKSKLTDTIISEVEDPILQTLILLRYVSCLSFKETALRMRCGLRHVFRLHENFLKSGICLHIATQNDS